MTELRGALYDSVNNYISSVIMTGEAAPKWLHPGYTWLKEDESNQDTHRKNPENLTVSYFNFRTPLTEGFKPCAHVYDIIYEYSQR